MRDVLVIDHTHCDLRDHIPSWPTNESRSQDRWFAFLGQYFNEAVINTIANGPINLTELPTIDCVLDAFTCKLLFSFAHCGDLWVSERAPRKCDLVDVETLHK